jgi:DNA-binding PadR family transcriptional regulator
MVVDRLPRVPLSAQDLYILLALFDQPRHGYAIIQDVSTRTGGETRLGTSTVYAALKRMRAANLVAETSRPAGVSSDDERRRYYRATTVGRAAAEAAAREIQRLHQLMVDARLIQRRAPSSGRSRS